MKIFKYLWTGILCVMLVMILCCCGQAAEDVANDNSSGMASSIEKKEVLENETFETTTMIETTTLEETFEETTEEVTSAQEIETTIVEVNVEQNNLMKEKLQKYVQANTMERLLSYYLSFQYVEHGLNFEEVKTTYYEGYQDIQGNKAIRIKNNNYNTEYPFEKVPYYVKSKKGSWAEVIDDDSSPLPKSHFLQDENIKNNDVIKIIYGRDSIIDDRGEVIDIDESKENGHIVIQYSKDIIIKTDEIKDYYDNILGVKNIDYFIYDYEFDKRTLSILSKMEIAVTTDGKDYNISNTNYSYDVNILPSIKVVNDEDGEVVYFDTKKLEKANTYTRIKKDIASITVEDKKYDVNGNLTQNITMYKDEDGNVVVKEVRIKEKADDINNPLYRVKFDNKWFDVKNNKVMPSSLTTEELKAYDIDPIVFVTGRNSLVDSTEKTVMSYEDNGLGIVIQEDKELNDVKKYISEVLPSIPNVIKVRRKVTYDMDDDVVKNWTLSSYTLDGKSYKVEDLDVKLDTNEPKELEKVMDYVENMGEED